MNFAKFFRNLTACLLMLWLVGCAQTKQSDSEKAEAVTARIKLAFAYLDYNDYAKAKENIDKALQHDPNHYLPHSVLAYYYQLVGETKQAEAVYQKALKFSEKDGQARPDVLNNYGTFLCKQHEFDNAYNQFEQALTSKQPYYNQADTLENIVLCANLAKNAVKQKEALKQLEKLDKARADELKKTLE
ncbi:type IV pilus biogenesis/stability protein PilW [Glaesserella sp.]|uniref:type IV pilus biogenesis/stability protein PilW n=1 Tax=Glaesserella sp. TaxID=2094731 RepID=UPI0035A05EB9